MASFFDQALFELGIEQFNRGAYRDAHETLESVWIASSPPERDFLKGILQIDVALYHLRHGNKKGAELLLCSSLELLRDYAQGFLGVDIQSLRDDCTRLLTHIRTSMEPEPAPIRIARSNPSPDS